MNTKTHPREQKETKETKVVDSKDKCLQSAKMPLVPTFARSREYPLASLRFLRYLLFNFSASVNRIDGIRGNLKYSGSGGAL